MNIVIQTTFSSYQNLFAPLLSYKENDPIKTLLPQLAARVNQLPSSSYFAFRKIYPKPADSSAEKHKIPPLQDRCEIQSLKKRFNYWHDYISDQQIAHEYTSSFKYLIQLAGEIVSKNALSLVKFSLRKHSIESDSLLKAMHRFEQRLFHILSTPHHHKIEAGLSGHLLSPLNSRPGYDTARSKSSLNLPVSTQGKKNLNEEVITRKLLQQRFVELKIDEDGNWKNSFNLQILEIKQKDEWVSLATCLNSFQIKEVFKLMATSPVIENQWLLDFIFNLPCEELLTALETMDKDILQKLNAMLILLAKGREMAELHQPFTLQRSYLISTYINQANNKIDSLNEKLRNLNHPDQINFKEHIQPIFNLRQEAIIRKNRFKKFQLLIKNLFTQFYETTKLMHGFTDTVPVEWRRGSDERRQETSEIEEKFDEIIRRLDDKEFIESGMPFDIIHGLVLKAYGVTSENLSIKITEKDFSIEFIHQDPLVTSKPQNLTYEKVALKTPEWIGKVHDFFSQLVENLDNRIHTKREIKRLKNQINDWHDQLAAEQIKNEYTPSFIFLIQLATALIENNTLDNIKFNLRNHLVENESLFEAINRFDRRLVHILATPHNHSVKSDDFKGCMISRFTHWNSSTPSQLHASTELSESLKHQYDLKKQIIYRKATLQRFGYIKIEHDQDWKTAFRKELLTLKQKEEWESLATCVNCFQIKEVFRLIDSDPSLTTHWLLDFIFNLPCEELLKALEAMDQDKLEKLNALLVSLSKERDMTSLHQVFTIQRTFIISSYINQANNQIDALNEKLRNLTNPHQINFKKHIKPIFSMRAEATIRKNRFIKFQSLIKNLFSEFYETTKLMHGFTDPALAESQNIEQKKKHRTSEIAEKFDEIIRRLSDKEFSESGMPFDIIHGLVFSTYELTDEDSSIDVLGSWNIVKAQQYFKAGLLGDITQKEFYDDLHHSNPYKSGYEMLKNKRIGTIKQLKKHHIYNRHFLEEYLAYTSNALYNKDPMEKVLAQWNLKPEEMHELGLLGGISLEALSQLNRSMNLIQAACNYLVKFNLATVKDLKVQRIYNKRNLSDYLKFHSKFNQSNASLHEILKVWKLDSFQAYVKLGLFKGLSKNELEKIGANPDKDYYTKIADQTIKRLCLESYVDLKKNKIYNKNLLRNYIRFN